MKRIELRTEKEREREMQLEYKIDRDKLGALKALDNM